MNTSELHPNFPHRVGQYITISLHSNLCLWSLFLQAPRMDVMLSSCPLRIGAGLCLKCQASCWSCHWSLRGRNAFSESRRLLSIPPTQLPPTPKKKNLSIFFPCTNREWSSSTAKSGKRQSYPCTSRVKKAVSSAEKENKLANSELVQAGWGWCLWQ